MSVCWAFSDWLRTSKSDRELYARCKRELAQREWKYTQNYADAKTAVIEDILLRAWRRPASRWDVIFDLIGLGEPSLDGKSWTCGEDWAVLVETTEDQDSPMLIRTIETFRRVDQLYRRGREAHRGSPFRHPSAHPTISPVRVCHCLLL